MVKSICFQEIFFSSAKIVKWRHDRHRLMVTEFITLLSVTVSLGRGNVKYCNNYTYRLF